MQVFLSENIVSVVIFVLALVVMIYLARKDQTSLTAGHHVDMKSVIVSVGVLGTFVGIFIGLWGFDTQNIDDSVPDLLEGLKLAFATSIAGMGISIYLSIKQKDHLIGGDDELSVLAEINDKLSGLGELNEQVKGLRLEFRDEQRASREIAQKTHEAIGSLATEESLKNFRLEVHEGQIKGRNFLEQQFIETNKSLKEAIDVLSKGATEEIIKALEGVIQDFNNNLTKQFGDNFKELNAAVLNLVTWQEQFKGIVEKDYVLLVEIRESLSTSSTTLESIAARNSEVVNVYEQVKDLIVTHHHQVQVLDKQLEQLSLLSDKAGKSFDVLNNGFEKVQAGMGAQSEAIADLTKDISKKLPESLGQLERTLVGLTDRFGKDYKAFLENYRNLLP